MLDRPQSHARGPGAPVPQAEVSAPLVIEQVHEGDWLLRHKVQRVSPAAGRVETDQRIVNRAEADAASATVSQAHASVDAEQMPVGAGDDVVSRINDRAQSAQTVLRGVDVERQTQPPGYRPRVKGLVMERDFQVGAGLFPVKG